MFKIEQMIAEIPGIDGDFTAIDIENKFGVCRTTARRAIKYLIDEGKLFNVVQVLSGRKRYYYNNNYRPLDKEFIATDTLKGQVMFYMLWLEKDFTMVEIANLFDTSSRLIYDAKDRLEGKKKIFNVGYLTSVTRTIKVYSKVFREYEGRLNDKMVIEEPRKAQRKTAIASPVYRPVDPLAGMAVPHG